MKKRVKTESGGAPTGKDSDAERSIAIALLLGFKNYRIKVNGEPGPTAWEYPPEFRGIMAGIPEYEVPDFMGMIRDKLADYEWHQHGVPRCPNNAPDAVTT